MYPLDSVLYLLLPGMDLDLQQSKNELCILWSVVLALLLHLLADDFGILVSNCLFQFLSKY